MGSNPLALESRGVGDIFFLSNSQRFWDQERGFGVCIVKGLRRGRAHSWAGPCFALEWTTDRAALACVIVKQAQQNLGLEMFVNI